MVSLTPTISTVPTAELFLVIPIRAWDDAQTARSVGAVKQ